MKGNCLLNTISVASINAPGLGVYSILNDGKIVHVWDAILIRLLSQVFRVPYKIFVPPDDEYGRFLPDGNWSGMIGMVGRSEVDIAVGFISLAEERFQAVNFSYPYLFSDITFMTDKLKPLSTDLVLLYPISLMVWILIMVIIFSVSFILVISTNKKQSFQSILFMVFGSLMGSTHFKVRKINLALLLSTWLIFVFVITNSYKGLLLSFLLLPSRTGIRTIPDLAKAAEQNSITCYTYKGHVLPHILHESELETWRSIGKCLKRNVITHGDAEKLFLKAPPNKAFVGGRIFMMQYENDYFISKESFFNDMYALPISRNFCNQKTLNKVIHRLFSAGLFSKHLKDEQLLWKLNIPTSESRDHKKLRITDLEGAFVMLICGYILASFVFLIEIAIKYYFPRLNKEIFYC